MGLALSRGRGHPRGVAVRRVLFAVVAVNAADLDYLAGLAVGDIGGFHRGVSHSLGAAVLFGVVAGLVAWLGRGEGFGRVAGWGCVLYASHMVFDLAGFDNGGPSAMPLLWPLMDASVEWPWPLLPGLTNATEGAQLGIFIRSLASMSNAWVVLVELLVLGPLALLAWRSERSGSGTWRAWRPAAVRGEGEGSTAGGTP